MIYRVCAQVVTHRDGWTRSTGAETFYVEADSASSAEAKAERILQTANEDATIYPSVCQCSEVDGELLAC